MPLLDQRERRRNSTVPRYRHLGSVRLGYRCYTCKSCNTKRVRFYGNPAKCPNCGNVDSKDEKYLYMTEAGFFVLDDAPRFSEVYGEKPMEIDIKFPWASLQSSLCANYTLWGAGVPLCKGDGRDVIEAWPMSVTEEKGRTKVKSAPGRPLVRDRVAQSDFGWGESLFPKGERVLCSGGYGELYSHCKACSAHVDLRFEPANESIYEFGYYNLSTGSIENYNNLEQVMMDVISEIGVDKFTYVPFKLRLVERKRGYFDDQSNTRKTSDHFYLELLPPDSLMAAIKRHKLSRILALDFSASVDLPQLPTGEDINTIEAEYIEQEDTSNDIADDVINEIEVSYVGRIADSGKINFCLFEKKDKPPAVILESEESLFEFLPIARVIIPERLLDKEEYFYQMMFSITTSANGEIIGAEFNSRHRQLMTEMIMRSAAAFSIEIQAPLAGTGNDEWFREALTTIRKEVAKR